MPPEKKKEKKKGRSKASSSGSAEGPLVQLRPSQILYTYSKVLPYFSGCGRTLAGTLHEIESGEMKPSDLPAIAVISAEVPVESNKAGEDDGWSSDEDGRGEKGKGRKGKKGNDSKAPEKIQKFFSTNNRRLWVLKQCESKGLLGEERTVGVRLQRPDVSKRMVEKGSRSFRIERSCENVKILDVEAPGRVGQQNEEEVRLENEKDGDGEDAVSINDGTALEQVTEQLEEFHPVLRPHL